VLDALRPSWSTDATECIVLDHEHVAAVSPAAHRSGVSVGMRKSGAAIIAPQATLLERSPEKEHALLHQAALAMLQYTPEVALADDHTLLLNVSASLMLFKGPRGISRRVTHTLRAMQLNATQGMAVTARGAWLLARRGQTGPRRRVRLASLHTQLNQLPLSLLPAAQKHADWLRGIGCHTLGALRRLPRAGLQRRVGTEVVRAMDVAYGEIPEVHAWFTAPLVFKQRIELIERLEHTSAVHAVAQELIAQMSGWLVHRQRAITQLILSMEHEIGRHARPPTQLALPLAAPAWQASHLQHLLKEKLDRVTLEAPVVAIGLETPDTVEMPAISTTLFPEPGGTAADHMRLLDLLAARLGPEQVRQPNTQADHRPETANQWRTAIGRATPACPPADIERPFWLLDPPEALSTHQDKPYYGSPLTLVKGPERIETGWWDGGLAVRDYFVAQDKHYVHYWIYRERDHHAARWYLHGLFG